VAGLSRVRCRARREPGPNQPATEITNPWHFLAEIVRLITNRDLDGLFIGAGLSRVRPSKTGAKRRERR